MAKEKTKNQFYVHLPNGDFNGLTDVGDLANQIDFELGTSQYDFVIVTSKNLTPSKYLRIIESVEKILKEGE